MAQKVSLDLNQFKSSGIYTLEYDASERIVIDTQTIRLIVGFSRKGPWNAPFYLPDAKTAKTVYGEIDTWLEKQGSFFHRSLYTALDVGPVYALNLLPLNNHPDIGDKVPYQSLSIASTEPNGKKIKKLYSSFYNKERFWRPDQDYLLANVNSPGSVNTGKLLNIVNLGQKPVSVLVRKTKPAGFNITALEWYGKGNVPSFIYEDDIIADYFVEVMVVEGDWTNYRKLAQDPIFSEYFNREGLKKSKMSAFLSAPEVTIINSTIGSIIPDFYDKREINWSIDTLVNNSFSRTGVFIAIDRNALEEYDPTLANSEDYDTISAIDMIGHNIAKSAEFDPLSNRENPEILDFLSYKLGAKEKFVFDKQNLLTDNVFDVLRSNLPESGNPDAPVWRWDSELLGGDYGYYYNTISVTKPNTTVEDDPALIEFYKLKNLLVIDKSIIRIADQGTVDGDGNTNYHYGLVRKVYETEGVYGRELKIVFSNKNKPREIERDTATGKAIQLPIIGLFTQNETYGAVKFKITDSSGNQIINPANYTGYNSSDQILIKDPITEEYTYLDMLDYNGATAGGIADYYDNEDLGTDPDYLVVFVQNNSKLTKLSGMVRQHLTETEYNAKVNNTLLTIADFLGVDGEVSTTTNNFNYALKTYGQPYKSSCTWLVNKLSFPGLETDEADEIKFYAEPDRTMIMDDQSVTFKTVVADEYSKIFKYWDLGVIQDGYYTRVRNGVGGDTRIKYLEFDQITDSDSGAKQLLVKFWDNFTQETDVYGSVVKTKFSITDAVNNDISGTVGTVGTDGAIILTDYLWDRYLIDVSTVTTDQFEIITNYGNVKKLVDIIPSSISSDKTHFSVTYINKDIIEVGDYMVAYKVMDDGSKDYRLTKVMSKIRKYDSGLNNYIFEYTTILPIHYTELYQATRIKDIEDQVEEYNLFCLEGFKMTDWHMPNRKQKFAQLEKILGVLDEANTNLTNMLIDKDIIDFRYIVDTFDGSINPNTYPKTYLTKLAMKRQKCLAIMNAPSMKEFLASTNPRFTSEPTLEDPKPVLQASYIADGGNRLLGPSFLFSLPDEANGSKFAGYFSPNLLLRENGKTISVPPAAHVSNNFIRKFISGQPYALVAGTKRGVISDAKLTGLEYEFLQGDRDFLEPLGINPIIFKRGKGHVIWGNQMAYQKTLSAYNNLHVRDLLITIEKGVEDILGNYLFEFNDDATRLEIKVRVDKFLENVRTEGGVYAYQVIMDNTNNTPEVIDQNTAIIDIAIEPVRGLHKIINRITVMKTGQLASSGFSL